MSTHQVLCISHGKVEIIVEGGVLSHGYQRDQVVGALGYIVKIENKSLFVKPN